MKESRLTIPCHWNGEVLNRIVSNNDMASTRVVEMYGALANGGPIGHGRSPESVVGVDRKDAKSFKDKCNQNGISFTYLLNAPFRFDSSSETIKGVDEYLDWIVGDFKADALTISSYDLMKHVRERYPDIPIHISTIAGVRSLDELYKFLDLNPNRLVPHHDLGKRIDVLKELVSFGEKNNIDIEILTTESCLFNCPNRKAHYEYLSKGSKDNPFHLTCNSRKILNPEQLLMAGGVIRPEDIPYYSDLGVSFFKISGRSKPPVWLPEVVEAYQTNSFRGNLIRLLGIDPSLEAENWMFLDNKSLDGFIQGFPYTNLEEAEDYCKKWISNLYKSKKFYFTDGTSYAEIPSGRLAIDNIGVNSQKIISREQYE